MQKLNKKNIFYKKNRNYKKYIFIISIIFIFLLLIMPTIMNFIFFPKKINLLEGNTHKIDFNIPAIATIVSDDESILKINNEPLGENDNIKLNEPVYLQSKKEGSVNMKVSLMGIPIKDVTLSVLPNKKLIPGGEAVGVRIDTKGVMVLGLGSVIGEDNKKYEPSKNILEPGDLILNINDKKIDNKEDLIKEVENNKTLNIEVKRNNNIENVKINSVKGQDGKNKIGAWVRDSTQGIGTLTYIDEETKAFGALGHGILDVDTREIMEVKDGKIMNSEIIDVKKGEKGSPGELVGSINKNQHLGNIVKNTNVGIYGKIIDDNFINNKEAMPIGFKDSVKIGDAYILCNVGGDEVKKYNIKIESINKYNIDSSKSMVIKITDKELLEKTNGIIQGMSGSPIIQDGKIIGAVTHVFVNEPSKGYGIFIENMIDAEKNI